MYLRNVLQFTKLKEINIKWLTLPSIYDKHVCQINTNLLMLDSLGWIIIASTVADVIISRRS